MKRLFLVFILCGCEVSYGVTYDQHFEHCMEMAKESGLCERDLACPVRCAEIALNACTINGCDEEASEGAEE